MCDTVTELFIIFYRDTVSVPALLDSQMTVKGTVSSTSDRLSDLQV
jgi:hypothetical protein